MNRDRRTRLATNRWQDSRIMKTRQGGYVQGCNAQAVVSEEQIIVAVGVTQEANDVSNWNRCSKPWRILWRQPA